MARSLAIAGGSSTPIRPAIPPSASRLYSVRYLTLGSQSVTPVSRFCAS